MIPCVQGAGWPRGAFDGPRQAGRWGSIVPAFWSFMLAARGAGPRHRVHDAGTWCTSARVAQILGIPYDEYTQAGLTPIAHHLGGELQAPAARHPARVDHPLERVVEASGVWRAGGRSRTSTTGR